MRLCRIEMIFERAMKERKKYERMETGGGKKTQLSFNIQFPPT